MDDEGVYFCWGCEEWQEHLGKTGYFCCPECWSEFTEQFPDFFARRLANENVAQRL